MSSEDFRLYGLIGVVAIIAILLVLLIKLDAIEKHLFPEKRALPKFGFPYPWRKVHTGVYATKDEFMKELEFNRCFVGVSVAEFIRGHNFFLSGQREEFDLALVSVHELGFPYGGYLRSIYQKGFEAGMKKCKAHEIGPMLRIIEQNQPVHKINVCMASVSDPETDDEVIFSLERDGGFKWIMFSPGNPEAFYSATEYFVFWVPKKAKSKPAR